MKTISAVYRVIAGSDLTKVCNLGHLYFMYVINMMIGHQNLGLTSTKMICGVVSVLTLFWVGVSGASYWGLIAG